MIAFVIKQSFTELKFRVGTLTHPYSFQTNGSIKLTIWKTECIPFGKKPNWIFPIMS